MEENNQNLYEAKNTHKKPKGKLIGLIIAAVLILGVSVGIFAFVGQSKGVFNKLKGTPEEIVMKAMSNTNNKILLEQQAMQEQLGAKAIESIQNQEANALNFDLVLHNVEGVENQEIVNAYIKDLGLSGSLQTVKGGSKGTGNLSVTQGGIELIGASLYKVGNEVGISIPKLLDSPYAVKLDSFVEDYKKSALFELMGGQEIDEEGFAEIEQTITAFSDYMVGAMNLSTNKEFMQQSGALQAQLIKDAGLREKDKTTLLLSNGKEKECSVYAGTLTDDQTIQFFKDEMEVLMSQDFIKNYFEAIGKQAGYTMEDLQAELDTLVSPDEQGKLEIEFLIDDTYFVGMNLNFVDVANNESVGTCRFSYAGVENLTEAIYFDLDMVSQDEVPESVGIHFIWKQNAGEKPDVITQELIGTLSENDIETVSFNYNYAYDTKGTEDNLKVTFGMDAKDEGTIGYNATGTKTISNSEVSTNLTKASLNVNTDGESFTLNFGLNYGMKAIKESDVVIDQTGVKYLFEMTQEELIAVVQKLQTNIQSLAYAFL